MTAIIVATALLGGFPGMVLAADEAPAERLIFPRVAPDRQDCPAPPDSCERIVDDIRQTISEAVSGVTKVVVLLIGLQVVNLLINLVQTFTRKKP